MSLTQVRERANRTSPSSAPAPAAGLAVNPRRVSRLFERYRNLLLLILGFVVVFAIAETTLRAIGSPYLLTQRNGPGQIVLYLMGLVAILWFCQRVAGVSPADFIKGYLRDWRRALRGFLFCWLIGTGAMLLIHSGMIAAGSASISWDAVSVYGFKAFRSTVTAMLAMLVLVLAEELIFRGFVLRYLRGSPERIATVLAVIVASAIFSLSHTVSLGSRLGSEDLPNLLFGLFMLGALLSTVYIATGSLACAMGIHAALLGFKVFLRKTHFIDYHDSSLMGGSDLRTGPALWLIMLTFIVAFALARRWLSQHYRIETAYAVASSDRKRLGFRLEAASEKP